jgi:hypothetical protein
MINPLWSLKANPVICPNCDASYFSVEALEALPYVGVQEGGEHPLALFNCGCSSTLAVEIIPEASDLQLL